MNTNELFISGNELPQKLTKEEMYKLLEKVKQGDLKAKEKVVMHNIRLVVYLVFKYFDNTDYEKKDLISIGNIGLLKAIDTFDVLKNIEFSSYACRCILNEIYMFLRQSKAEKNKEFSNYLRLENKDLVMKVEYSVSDDVNIEETYIENELYQRIRNIVDNLPYPDDEIIKMYFGFYDGVRYKQGYIAEKFGFTQSIISRRISSIVRKIGKELEKEGLIETKKRKIKTKDK